MGVSVSTETSTERKDYRKEHERHEHPARPARARAAGAGSARDAVHPRCLTRSRALATSRNWSVAQSWAAGTNWSSAAAAQRVYEFAVEPSVLQGLPDHALLLTVPGRTGPDLRAVECDPAIVTLPGVSTRPLPPVQVPAQVSAARHAADRLPERPAPVGQQSPLAELTRTWSSRRPWEDDHRPRHSR